MNLPAIFLLAPGLLGQPLGDGLGINIHFTRAGDRELDLLQEGGIRWVRMDFTWAAVERRPGEYDFSGYDRLLESTAPRGIRHLWILDYGHPSHTGGLPPATPPGRAAFARFAAAAAAHFKGKGILWEIWNEPNIEHFWKPAPDVADYVALAREAIAAIRAADPEARVAIGATSTIDFPFIEGCFRGGLTEICDAVTVHPYRRAAPETLAPEILRLRNLLARYLPAGRSAPILSGEWGYNTRDHSRAEQARFLVRQQIHNRLIGIPVSIWYDWKDDGPDPGEREHRFGTVEYQTLDPKPSFVALRNLNRELGAFAPAKRIEVDDPAVFIALFAGGEGALRLACWALEPRPNAGIPIGDAGEVEAVSIDGSRRFLDAAGGILAMDLGPDPVILKPAPGRAGALEPLQIELGVAAEPAWAPLRAGESAAVRLRIHNPLSRGLAGRIDLELADGIGEEEKPVLTFQVPPGETAVIPFRFRASRPLDGERDVTFTARFEDPLRAVHGRWHLLLDPVARFPLALPGEGNLEVVAEPTGSLPLRERYQAALNPGGSPRQVPAVLELPLPAREAGEFTLSIRDSGAPGPQALVTRLYRRLPESRLAAPSAEGDPGVASEAGIEALEGAAGFRVRYRFGAGWKYLPLRPEKPLELPGRPRWYALRVRGDGSGDILRCRIADSTGQTFQFTLGNLRFEGWRWLRARVDDPAAAHHWGGKGDGVLHPPLRWDALALIDSASRAAHPGDVAIAEAYLIEEIP